MLGTKKIPQLQWCFKLHIFLRVTSMKVVMKLLNGGKQRLVHKSLAISLALKYFMFCVGIGIE